MKKLKIIIEQAENNYSAYIDWVDGITTATGNTIDEVLNNVVDATTAYIESCNSMGVKVPEVFLENYVFVCCFPEHKPDKMDRLYCTQCGSDDTVSMAWVSNLTNQIDCYIGGKPDEESNICNNCTAHTTLLTLQELWNHLSEVPVNNDDEIEEDFFWFPKGTSKFDIWHWFDERCPNNLYDDLM